MTLKHFFFPLFFREPEQKKKQTIEVVTITDEKNNKPVSKPKPNVKPKKDLHKEIEDLEISNSVKLKELLHKMV